MNALLAKRNQSQFTAVVAARESVPDPRSPMRRLAPVQVLKPEVGRGVLPPHATRAAPDTRLATGGLTFKFDHLVGKPALVEEDDLRTVLLVPNDVLGF